MTVQYGMKATFSEAQYAWLKKQPPGFFSEQSRLWVADAMRLEQERAELQNQKLVRSRNP